MARASLSMLIAALLDFTVAHATQLQPPTGYWFTPDRGGVVQISPCGADLCGVIVGLTPSPMGVLPRDVTGATQCHLSLLRNLSLHGDGRWHGTVRNPEDGRVYQAEVWLSNDGSMRLRGYIGVPLLGTTQIWQRFDGALRSDCRFH